ncbi:MAG TPA: EamA family transporter, partial [Erythrobacter sp.]|nr:EamA family transporter [Erythrobacter sp.]
MSFRALLIMAFCNIAWALNVVVSKLAITDFSAPPLFYALVRSI